MSAREEWSARFEALVAAQKEPAWMTALRRRAWERFLELGLPDRRNERWKYTSLIGFARQNFVTPEYIETDVIVSVDGVEAKATLTTTNGFTDLGASDLGRLGVDVAVRPLNEAWEDARQSLEARVERIADGFEALSFAFAVDGAVVFIGNDVELDQPIRLVRRTLTPNAFAPVLDRVVVGLRARASMLVRYEESAAGAFSGGLMDVLVRDGAGLEHVVVQSESPQTWHVSNVYAEIQRDAFLRSITLADGGRIGRHEYDAELLGQGSRVDLNSLSLGRGSQTIDHTTRIHHAVPNCESGQLCRTILDGTAHGVFSGTVKVAKDAQQTNAEQLNNNLLLTREARADTRPQLEIAADDVKCGHGATIGQLSDEEVFYLMSRAIPRDEARRLLIIGFAQEVVESIENDELRTFAIERIDRWLRNAESN